jgi:hypothetical protein
MRLYFRNRASRFRPYLSGSGIVRIKTEQRVLLNARNTTVRLPAEFANNEIPLRVAVGIDIAIRSQFAIRYSFSETITRNPVSSRLIPRGERNLANFQNLFGIVKYF